MAHEISIQNGRAEIAYAGDTPWHGLGTKVDGLQTAQDMVRAAGLDWTVGLRPLLMVNEGGGHVPVESHRAIYREDVGRVLGVASARYQPIQNAQAADVVDALVAEGGAHVEVAGALGQGERCWMLAQLPGDFEVVKGDRVRPYFLLAWGHDGKHGLAGTLTPIRVVCNNTLTAAGFGKGQKWSEVANVYIRHCGDPKLRIDEAQRALGLVRKQVAGTAAAYEALARPIGAPQGRRVTSPPCSRGRRSRSSPTRATRSASSGGTRTRRGSWRSTRAGPARTWPACAARRGAPTTR